MAVDQKVMESAMRDWGSDMPPIPTGETFERTTVLHANPSQIKGAWRSAEEMIAAVHRAYPEGSLGRRVEVNANGEVFRWVQHHTGNAPVGDESGVLMEQVRRERIPVAYSQQEARAASDAGRRTDWFNGWTWVKGGIKTERDRATMATLPGADPNIEIVYEPASEDAQRRYRAQVAALSAQSGVSLLPAPIKRGRKPASEE